MAESALFTDDRGTRTGQALPAQGFERLQELMRHGYVPDPRRLPGSEGLLLRHQRAPNLVLRPDGSVDVPLGQPLKSALAEFAPEPPRRKRRWFRALLIVVGLGLYTFFAIAVLAGVLESM